MLQGNLSTQDEEDVEDELEALQREVAEPQVHLPAPPTKEPPKPEPVVEEATEETRTPLAA